jgi:hypothetical protein
MGAYVVMASLRPGPSGSSTSAVLETWAVRLSFGVMILGMAGFVIYDLIYPGPADASTTTEDAEEPEEKPLAAAASPKPTTDRRRAPSRFSRSNSLAAPPTTDRESHDDVTDRPAIATPLTDDLRPGRRPFLSVAGSRLTPGDEMRSAMRPVETAPEPVPAPPPPQQPVDPPEPPQPESPQPGQPPPEQPPPEQPQPEQPQPEQPQPEQPQPEQPVH